MCKHMAPRRKGKAIDTNGGGGGGADGAPGRGTDISGGGGDTSVPHRHGKAIAQVDGAGGSGTGWGKQTVGAGTGGSRGRQIGGSTRGRRPVRAGTGGNERGTGEDSGRESGGSRGRQTGVITRGRGGIVTRGRGAIGSPNSTSSPASVGSKRPAASPIDSGVGSKCKAILTEGGGRSGVDGGASTSNAGTVSEWTTSASLSQTSIPAQYPSRTLQLNLCSPTPEVTTQEVPEEEEDYEMPQYEVEEGEEDDEEENDEEEEDEDEDEVDAPVPEDGDFDQLLDELMQLPGREQLTRLSVDPIPPVNSIW